MPRERLCTKIESMIIEIVNEVAQSKVRKQTNYTKWDDKMKKAFSGLIIPRLCGIGQSDSARKKRSEVMWEAAKGGWIKINFDDVAWGNPRLGGARCVA